MNDYSAAVHRTIVVVDVEGFGDHRRTNQNQLVIREGLYLVMQEAFHRAGISWSDHYYEDRGDGMFILVGPEVPKSVFVELLPYALVSALSARNSTRQDAERIRLRMALHAGEVNYDEYGVTSSSINVAFRLIASELLRKELTQSLSVLALITSAWFFEEVVRHSTAPVASYRPVQVKVKETEALGWMYLPDYGDGPIHLRRDRSTAATSVPERSTKIRERASQCRKALTHYYRAALAEPITPAEGLPIGLEVPSLEEGYIDHRIRVAEVTSSSDPGRESWWVGAPVKEAACRFLTELLSSNMALKVPLILLGHPGSGKSILTRILAGSLPETDFLPVRIELRKVPAEADLQQIIEFAVRATTGESIHWPQLVETAPGARPVVILDGFDELLQATGVLHSDFLTDVQEFQRREHAVGRPLVVIVTSRIAVTDRALIPRGATVIKLEPFNEDQVKSWLGTWARYNQTTLSGRGLTPLPAEIALNFGELAEQPLLLLMLALYDADGNVLQRRSTELGRTELYASLLKDFAGREISRQSGNLSAFEFENEVENELLRLSIAAFSMFNRRSQWVHETDLDADLSVLLNRSKDISSPVGKRAQLSLAQLTIGRFFFIYESRAIRGGGELRTYEFLHSTFGEFLVARLVVRILSEMVSANGPAASQSASIGSEDILYALLSFSALTARSPIVIFINDLLDQLAKQRRADAAELLLQLHARALFSRGESFYCAYEPIVLRATERYAAWSVNLVILAVLVGGEITGSQLYPDAKDAVNKWREEVMIWRSQLSGHGWEELHEAIALERVWEGQRREIRLRLNDGTFNAGYPDLSWMYDSPVHGSGHNESFVDRRHNSHILQRKVNFICNMSEDILIHSLQPAISLFPAVANVFVVIDDRMVSAANAFIAAIYAPYEDGARREAAFLDLARVAVKLIEIPDMDRDASYLSSALTVLIPAVERRMVSPSALAPFARIRRSLIYSDSRVTQLLAQLDDLLFSSGIDAMNSQDDEN